LAAGGARTAVGDTAETSPPSSWKTWRSRLKILRIQGTSLFQTVSCDFGLYPLIKASDVDGDVDGEAEWEDGLARLGG
jgi:hypothetical protein